MYSFIEHKWVLHVITLQMKGVPLLPECLPVDQRECEPLPPLATIMYGPSQFGLGFLAFLSLVL